MRILFLLTFLSFTVNAVTIPLETDDQSKLLSLLKNIPHASRNTEDRVRFIRRHFEFPATSGPLVIKCSGDFYRSSPVPSAFRCSVDVTEGEGTGIKSVLKNDEFQVTISDTAHAAALFKAIPYGEPEKKFHSIERTLGKSSEGLRRELFRYSMSCSQRSCDLTFTARPSEKP